eukprot:CAMPEP_0204615150 /NCGR_PEP_ID=MMETSP0717-20131115/2718_1 /ASSEMBLY_ACC=CAM_ASM_000666 /TAXON_ID=230516 /ORGANISM="Chaetoceros curvisetus" /LENGTH=389 /DNA_ID=CAMNT_0051628017 /DNA_START=997 /DNA_END=2166 /DNA_ORIENTATION=+
MVPVLHQRWVGVAFFISILSSCNAFSNNVRSLDDLLKIGIQGCNNSGRRSSVTFNSRPSGSCLSMGFLDDIFKSSQSSPSSPSARAPKVTVPEDFIIPEPKPLTLTRPSDLPSVLKSSAALAVRLATSCFVLGWKIDTLFYEDDNEESNDKKYFLALGPFRIRDSSSVLEGAPRPDKPLILYEYDASPFSKRVREMINLLDLTVEYRPCPGARQSKFSEEMYEKTGRKTVPYLVDPNTGISMFESDDQIQYLLDTYGPTDKTSYDPKALWPITFKAFSIYTSTIAALLRDMPGSRRQADARPDNEDMLPIELWGYEASPFVKPVREKLVSLALPHTIVSCARGSANRDRLVERTGRFQVPYIVDPNTGLELFESPEICEYLDIVYTVKE